VDTLDAQRPTSRSRAPQPRSPRKPGGIDPALALVPLRAFLGITFVYAGLQKLGDPGFFHAGATSYIGSQLHAFATGTPGGFLLKATALHFPVFAGACVALTEIAVGLLVLMGLMTRAAAAVGLGLNLVLFLTASWNTHPYFLGSDIVFVFAWLPFVLAGAAGQPALDHVLAERSRRARAPARGGGREVAIDRRNLLARALGATALGTAILGGLAAATRGSYRGATTSVLSTHSGSGSPGHAASTPKPAATASQGLPSGAVSLGPASDLPAGQAAVYPDPADGQPDVVVRLSDGSLAAHSAVCTHAGCQVSYGQDSLVCPCHGSVFNAQTGAVEQGPAVDPLPTRHVLEHGGRIYAVPS
jgi:thiosulfate dehydrogenase [quinone] large subunit